MKIHKVFPLSLYRTFLNPRLVDVEDSMRLEFLEQYKQIRYNKGYDASQEPKPTQLSFKQVVYKDKSEQKKDYTRYADSVGCFVTHIDGNSYDLTIYNPIASIESGLMPGNRLKYDPAQDMYRTCTDLTCESVTLRLSVGDFILWDAGVEYSITPRDDTSHAEMIMAKFYTNTYGM